MVRTRIKGRVEQLRSAVIGSAVAAVAVVAWLPSGAWAQGAADQAAQNSPPASASDASAQAANNGGLLQEVVVTAEKRATDIQTTPISVIAVSGSTLESQNQTEIIQLQTTTPGLQVSNIGLYTAPNIRGIGNEQFSVAETPGVALIKDGIFLQGIHDTGDPFFDMADVEVLKGPQGDFVGFSSTGGAIEETTANPNFTGDNGYLEMQVGNYTDKRVDGALNAPLTDTFAVRVAFNWEQMHSFYRDIGALVDPGPAEPVQDPGQIDNKNVRLSMLWKPSASFNALLKIEYNDSDNIGNPDQPNQVPFTLPAAAIANGCPNALSPTGTVPAGPGGTCYSVYYPFSTHNPWVLDYGYGSNPAQAYLHLPLIDQPFWDYRDSLHLDYTLPNGIDIRSITGFQQGQWNTLSYSCYCSDAQSGVGYEYVPKDDYYSQEIDVLSPSTGKLTWIVGSSWFARWSAVTNDSITSTPPYTLAAPSITLTNNLTVQRMAAIFGRVSWQLTDTLQLQVGLRDNWDNNYTRGPLSEVQRPGAKGACTEAPAVLPGYGCILLPTTGAFEDTVPTGKVTLNWTPIPGQFFYVFYARGYTPGGYVAGATSAYQPEHVGDYELGWKTTLLGGHLQGSLGGYWMNYLGMQQQDYDIADGQGGITTNLGNASLRGIETEWNLREGGLGVNLNGSYEKSSLSPVQYVATYALPPASSSVGQCTGPGGTTPGAGQAKCFNYTPYLINLAGEPTPFSPTFSGTATIDYRIPLFGGELDPKLQFSYTSIQYGSLFETPYFEMGARHLLNAYLTYDKGKWDSELYMTNATNQTYINGNFGGTNVLYGNPMQLGIRIRKDF